MSASGSLVVLELGPVVVSVPCSLLALSLPSCMVFLVLLALVTENHNRYSDMLTGTWLHASAVHSYLVSELLLQRHKSH